MNITNSVEGIRHQTVANLRKAGFKVKVQHERYGAVFKLGLAPEYEIRQKKNFFNPKGGKTTVTVTSATGENYQGISACSKQDGFNRKFGVFKAIARIAQI